MSDDPYYMTTEEERKAIVYRAREQMDQVIALLDDLPLEAREDALQEIIGRYCLGCAKQTAHCVCNRCLDCGELGEHCICDDRLEQEREDRDEHDDDLPF